MTVAEIDTPALIVDLDVMERNLARVARYAAEHALRLRPHTKTHKSVLIGKRQLAGGAAGLTVAKVSEAEVMVDAGPEDLLVAYPVIGHSKLERLMRIAGKTNVTVALDSVFAARQLSDAARAARLEVGALAEVDVGLGRVGVAPGEELLHLAESLEKLPHLKLRGIAFYPGHIKVLSESGLRALDRLRALLASILADFRRAGIETPIHAHPVSFPRNRRSDGNPPRHLRVQRHEYGRVRRLPVGGLRRRGSRHGGFHGSRWADDHRRWI
jgi:D-serine deaminase-like pyridoxal phosphate-dependent protein